MARPARQGGNSPGARHNGLRFTSCLLITVDEWRLCDPCGDPAGAAVDKANFCGHMNFLIGLLRASAIGARRDHRPATGLLLAGSCGVWRILAEKCTLFCAQRALRNCLGDIPTAGRGTSARWLGPVGDFERDKAAKSFAGQLPRYQHALAVTNWVIPVAFVNRRENGTGSVPPSRRLS